MAATAYEVSLPSAMPAPRRMAPDVVALSLSARPSTSSPPSPTSRSLRHRPRPIPNSYWATPFLVACEFPYCPLTPAQIARKHTQQKLDKLLDAGVRTFIDLTEPHELFPYSPHLTERCTLAGIDPREVEYHNFPIRDRARSEA